MLIKDTRANERNAPNDKNRVEDVKNKSRSQDQTFTNYISVSFGETQPNDRNLCFKMCI